MKKEVYYLPDDFDGYVESDFYVKFYASTRSSLKQKVVFTSHLINIILTGHKEIYTQETFREVGNTQIVVVPAGNVLMSELTTSENIFKSIIITFSNKFLIEFIDRYAFKITGENTRETLGIITKDSFMYSFEESLLELKHLNTSAALFKIKIEEILCYLINKDSQLLNLFAAGISLTDERQKFKQLMELNINSNLNVSELAFLCNMSVSTFKRHFAEVFNTSPKKYFTATKMNKAKHLLLAHKRVSEIFAELGYESLSSFSAEFKKHFGVSPKQFQEQFELKAQTFELPA